MLDIRLSQLIGASSYLSIRWMLTMLWRSKILYHHSLDNGPTGAVRCLNLILIDRCNHFFQTR